MERRLEQRSGGAEERRCGGRVVERTPVPCASKMSEQAAVVSWWRLACRKYGVPEESLLRVAGEVAEGGTRGALLRRQGARPGAADLFLAVPRGSQFGLWLCVRGRGLRMRQEERNFLRNMEGLGYGAAVCRGRDEAKDRIHAYMVQRGEADQKNVS